MPCRLRLRPSENIILLVSFFVTCYAQADTLGLSNGVVSYNTSALFLQLVKDSQTAYSLRPSVNGTFDFIPYDVMSMRQSDGQFHLGDITFRARTVGSSDWISGETIAAANLSPTLSRTSLLNITRRWVLARSGLQLLFDVMNPQAESVEIGSLGAPLEFNNVFTDRTAEDTNFNCSLFDPYIGQDAGYVQVTPLLGTLPPLVITPVGKSPLEGWRFLTEDGSRNPFYQSQTFEGLYEWQFHTVAFAENEWRNVTPWNAPTSAVLQPSQSRTYGLQFNLAPSIRGIEDTVRAVGRPLAVGIPGYILPQDQVGKLFLSFSSRVRSIAVSPPGALSWAANKDSRNTSWVGYDITPKAWGRARLSIAYADGTLQTVHYYNTKAGVQVISDLGKFLTTKQWFDDPTDPFARSPSVVSYDREADAIVRDDPRAWIPGLSDEAGAGSWLAAAMKQYVQPSAAEVAKMEEFATRTLWGSIQNADGPSRFSVKKSVYFYQPALVPNYTYPSAIDWTNWWSWNQAASFATDRAYDYVHVTAAYWSLYRVARNYPSLVELQTWQWYLEQALETVLFMTSGKLGFINDGLMEETVFVELLTDLKREGLAANATLLEQRMHARQSVWAGLRFPFGSEMAWDSTGQEGVYAWSKYFNDTNSAANALNSILAYQPTIAHWGYNGNARRYWDNIYGGKLMRYERQIHHYGSGLNALPLISQFESDPNDFYLLRVGFGGLSGPLSNIDEGGFAAASFHSFADTLKWDGYSGDYGPNFVGHALNTGTYIVEHPVLGWQAFGGIVTNPSGGRTGMVQVQVRDSVRRRVFVAPLGTLFTLDAGVFDSVTFDASWKTVTFRILPAPQDVNNASPAPLGRMVVTQTSNAAGARIVQPVKMLTMDAGAWNIPFSRNSTSVSFRVK